MNKTENNLKNNNQTSGYSIDEVIYKDIVNSLYMALPGSVLATIIIAASLVAILWQEVNTTYLTVWLFSITVVNFIRFVSYRYYLKSKKLMPDIYFWDRVFVVLLILTGLIWSSVSIWLLPANDSLYHYVPALILIGISAGAVTSLGFKMQNLIIYFAFLLIPLFIREVIVGEYISNIISFLIIVFIVLALFNAKRINVAMIENISYRYHAEQHEQELIEIKDAAISANSAKANFISMISHELRTPLNAIMGFSQLLQMSENPDLNKEQIENTQGIIDSGKHLLSLIEELLDLSKIEAHKLDVALHYISLVDVLDESLNLLTPVADEYSVEIIKVVENEYLVEADPKRLKQIFINLVSNAIKYNHIGGKVRITVESVANNRVRISVKDDGQGLTKEQQDNLFKPFQRYDDEKEGIGLGLYITKNLVELMGGMIAVESDYGVGSTFWFELNMSADV